MNTGQSDAHPTSLRGEAPLLRPGRTNPEPLISEEALQRALLLAPRLRERSDQCLAERKAPDETIAELKKSGLIRLMQPKRFGGSELSRELACQIAQIFARECGSQAWVYHVLVDHAWMLGTYSQQAQEDVWGADPDVLISSSFAPTGRARLVDGGFELTGQFRFSSGIDHVDWVVVGGFAEGEKGPRHFLVRKSDGEVIDDWFVNGLEGTGSKAFQTKAAFVPEHRSVPLSQILAGQGPGTAVNSNPLYRAPRFGYTSAGFAALIVGMAQSFFDDWLKHVGKRGGPGGAGIKESTQIIGAKSGMEIGAAELLYLQVVRDGTQLLTKQGTLTESQLQLARVRVAYSVQLVLDAVVRLYNASGASVVYSGNNMERQFRNVMAGAQHGIIDWPMCAAGYGAHLFKAAGQPSA